MSSICAPLSDQEERLAIDWHTNKMCPAPDALDRLVRVVHVIEHHYLSDQYDHWIADGSVFFRNKAMPANIVRVWVDHDNALSDLLLTTALPPAPIAVGLDLTAHNPKKRRAIRRYLRGRFPFYCDPEQASRPIAPEGSRKIALKPDFTHWLDVVLLPEAPGNIPIDNTRLPAIEYAIGEGAPSWYL